MFVWPLGLMPAIADWMSWRPPSGAVWTTQCAESSNATTPELVLGAEGRGRPQDRLLADVDLAHAADPDAAARAAVEAVAVARVHRARLVDDDDERDVGLLLAVAHAHVDGQRLLERRVGVAAGAVAARPADHDEAPPEVADIDLERRHRRVREPQARDVDEDDRVVVGEPGEVRSAGPRG